MAVDVKVSVLIPTRGRLAACGDAIESLASTAADALGIEYILRADDDDPTPYGNFGSGQTRVIRGPRFGYAGIHRYYNELAELSTAEWLLVWNDDALMQTHGWDAMLPATQALTVIGKADGGFGFPCFPRSWYQAAGCVSESYLVDVYLHHAALALGCAQTLPWEVEHRALSDDVSAAGRAIWCERGWDGEALVTAMVERLRHYL